MQAVKNLLHSNKDETSTSHNSHNNEAHGVSGAAGVGNTSQPGYNTASSGVGSRDSDPQHNSGIGHSTSGISNTSSSARDSGLTSTNPTATRDTGLAGSSHADNSHVGSGRASHGLDHTAGHDHSIGSKFDPTSQNTTHDHKHLDHVTHRDVRHQEVEEVQREREHDRHVHHVQHHVQPVIDKQVKDEVHHTNTVPVTKIEERHTSTEEDRGLFQGLASQHKDSETHRPKERTVVDLGERVHENVHHHVHHVTQPVIEQEVVDRHKIHTVIPTHHVTHEAPIIHKSSTHEPVTLDAFKSGGGKLGSGITHENAGVLNNDNCSRTVDGVGEQLAEKLHLGSSGTGHGNYTSSTGSTGLGHSGGLESRHEARHDAKDRQGETQHGDGSYGEGRHVANDGERHKTSLGKMADDKHLTK